MKVRGKNIEISNRDKTLFPEDGITKEDLISYYRDIAPYLLPYVKDRPLMMQRFPDGIAHHGFYHKEAPDYFPDWIRTEKMDRKEGGKITHVICENPETLVYLANQACITLHAWLSRTHKPHHPDKLIMDLDPPTRSFDPIHDSLSDLEEYLGKINITGFLMTTGSKGLHIVIPVLQKLTFKQIKKKIDRLADHIVKEFNGAFTTAQHKDKREGKIYLDTMRNSYAQTGVVPYSLRPIEGAPVATPVSWEEARKKGFHARRYHLKNIFRRLGQNQDPWTHFYDHEVAEENHGHLSDI